MTVDAHVTRCGMETESTMMSSWRLGGKVSMANGQNLKLKLDAPHKENTLFTFK